VVDALDERIYGWAQTPTEEDPMEKEEAHNPGEPEFGEHQEEAPHNPGEPTFGEESEEEEQRQEEEAKEADS
jgi:hypothetical protein